MIERIPREFIVEFVAKKISPEKYAGLEKVVDSTLEVRKTLPNFLDKCSMGEGVFSKENIKKDTILMEHGNPKIVKMNDPLFKYSNVLHANTPEKLVDALFHARDSYYDILKACEKINVCLASNNGKMFYIANKDIYIGEQLFRVYGFEAWLFELQNCLTSDNVEGYYDFSLIK